MGIRIGSLGIIIREGRQVRQNINVEKRQAEPEPAKIAIQATKGTGLAIKGDHCGHR